MNASRLWIASTALAALLLAGGCATSAAPTAATPSSSAVSTATSQALPRYGVVQSIDLVQIPVAAATTTISGPALQTADAYKFTVLMDDRSYQSITQTTHGDIRVGDRVQVGNEIVRRN